MSEAERLALRYTDWTPDRCRECSRARDLTDGICEDCQDEIALRAARQRRQDAYEDRESGLTSTGEEK